MSDALPEPDRIDGAPHPRETQTLCGHDNAIAQLLASHASGRMHHGWLITGPRGIGKATLAWQFARFLLAQPADDGGLFGAPPAPTSLHVDPEHPVARRIIAGSETGLFHVRRPYDEKTKRLKQVITVEEIRKLKSFLALSAPDGGARVVIVDSADEMNVNAANALLKLLEEPPERTTLLLVSHQPARLLPTIRSRCQELRMSPLSATDLAQAMHHAGFDPGEEGAALADLTGGSAGRAISLMQNDGLKIYAELVGLLSGMPNLDRQRAIALADAAAQRGAEEKRDLLFELVELVLARLARTGASGAPPAVEAAPGEADTLRRLAPDAGHARAWAELAQTISGRISHGLAVNLDPATLILDTVFKIQKTAAG